MQATNVRALKKNPFQALRMARETGPVLILKGDEPDALLVHLGESLAAADRRADAASGPGSRGADGASATAIRVRA